MYNKEDYYDHGIDFEQQEEEENKIKTQETEANFIDQDEKIVNNLYYKLHNILTYYRKIDSLFNHIYISDFLQKPQSYYKIRKSIPVTEGLINEVMDCVSDSVKLLKIKSNKDSFHYLMSYDAILSNIMVKLKKCYITPIYLI